MSQRLGLAALLLVGAQFATADALDPSSPVSPAATPPVVLRVSLGEANGTPSVIYDASGVLRGGLGKDIADALAVALGGAARHVNLPRARQVAALERGEVDAACFLAPAWVANPNQLEWSPALFHIRQVVVSPVLRPPVDSPATLQDQRVGTLLNFVYPELQPYFASGAMLREDAPSLDLNLQKLRRERIDALVDIDLAVLYRIARHQMPMPVRVDPLWAAPNPVYCAFNRMFAQQTPGLHDALSQLVASGRIARWIHAYTGGVPVPMDTSVLQQASTAPAHAAQSHNALPAPDHAEPADP